MTGQGSPGGTLYVVSTPIGNLGDMTHRAIETLRKVDLVASEDTRLTGGLLAHFGIDVAQTSYHDHNERQKAPILIKTLLGGKSVALVSDAGTPLISDPGYRLINEAWEAGINIVPIPGASSILTALVAAGFPTDRFCFEGYLPNRSGKLRATLEALASERRTMIFFESPHRILKSLPVMLETLGDRDIFLGRELTKKFEEKIKGKISVILRQIENRSLKGEIVIVVPGIGRE
ncbi:MAG: 16S rRNA (cytidine(1402)-2'-O)-methyltransferase [candidate division Zixibacteria bacterium RBG_16_53_22]|nr:MAG: 16S rRNA (cytidine(1402)-2'-O)-methyltransferase [candidate division Zixibacteria bacterium RBG_16_53_22]